MSELFVFVSYFVDALFIYSKFVKNLRGLETSSFIYIFTNGLFNI